MDENIEFSQTVLNFFQGESQCKSDLPDHIFIVGPGSIRWVTHRAICMYYYSPGRFFSV